MIGAQPNEHPELKTISEHRFDLPQMCPVSHNPMPGSVLTIRYTPAEWFLEVLSLGDYIKSFVGGKQAGRIFIRDMEQTIQRIALDCAAAIGASVEVVADLKIHDGTATRDYRVIVHADPT